MPIVARLRGGRSRPATSDSADPAPLPLVTSARGEALTSVSTPAGGPLSILGPNHASFPTPDADPDAEDDAPMTDPDLTRRLRLHYEARAFSPALVDRLCLEIDRRSGEPGVEIAKGWWVSVERLIEALEPIEQTTRPAVLYPTPAAILCLAFGYRLDSPFARTPDARRPGPNNTSLAHMTERCHRLFPDACVAVQHEVGLALSERGSLAPTITTPARDWNTREVLDYLVGHLPSALFAVNRSVVVVSHLHHYGRIALLLEGDGLEAFPPPKEVTAYADYDASEAQPRFRSPWEYLVNDFLAICKIAARAPSSSRPRIAGTPFA